MKLSLLTILLILFAQNSFAGKNEWIVSGQVTSAFETRNVYLLRSKVEDLQATGILLSTGLKHSFNERYSVDFGVGFRAYSLKGKADQIDFEGNISKLLFYFGNSYKILKKQSIGINLQFENNLEYYKFRSHTSDLLRYSVQFEYQYEFTEKIGVFAALTTALYPLNDVYLIENPSHYIGAGFNYKIL